MFDPRIGKFVLVLPFAHPVRLAEDATTVDILSNGRFELGVGQGYAHSEFTRFVRALRPLRISGGCFAASPVMLRVGERPAWPVTARFPV